MGIHFFFNWSKFTPRVACDTKTLEKRGSSPCPKFPSMGNQFQMNCFHFTPRFVCNTHTSEERCWGCGWRCCGHCGGWGCYHDGHRSRCCCDCMSCKGNCKKMKSKSLKPKLGLGPKEGCNWGHGLSAAIKIGAREPKFLQSGFKLTCSHQSKTFGTWSKNS